MNVFIAWDGDHIGREVGRASLHDDVEGLRRISQQIDNGNRIWRSWIEGHGGSLISMGGDEGRAELPADYLDELPKIRQQYQDAVNATVSVGVGVKLSEADRALIAAKLRGGDRIEFYTDEVNAVVVEAEKKGQKTEEDKIADEYLNKAAPAMHPGAFSGATHPTAPTVDAPTPTQGDHEEVSMVMDSQENSGQSPELTHAGDDFENEFHDAAMAQEQEDTQGHAQATKNIDDVKKKLVVALQMLKQQAPILEQVKQMAPDAYNAIMGLAQAVVGLSREIQAAQPMKKAEIEEPVQLILSNYKVTLEPLEKNVKRNPQDMMVDAVRNALGSVKGHDCVKGDCYAGAESLYHLLGGNDAGWNPTVVSHQNGPHWFLKNRHSGKILDAASDQFELPPPYHLGKAKGFVTTMPSKRASQIIKQVLTRKSEDDVMQKMAIADIPGGKRLPVATDTYDYSHVLPDAHRKNKYNMTVRVMPMENEDTSVGQRVHAILMHHGRNVGYVAGHMNHSGPLQIDNSHIDQQHRGKGLGVPLYEALYAHAKNNLGVTHVGGHEHSTSAGRVHQAISQKHGLDYKPAIDKQNIHGNPVEDKPFDGRYFGYQYALKNELKTEKEPDDYDMAGDGDLEKSGLPMPKAPAHHHVTLPVGSTQNQKVKVQHSDGTQGWVSVQAGQVRSQDPSGHPVSSRNPGGK